MWTVSPGTRSFPTLAHHYRSSCSSFSQWLDSHFGVTSTIVTNRGRQFESELLHTLMTLLRSKRAHTTVYHPQTISMVKRFHRQLRVALRLRLILIHGWMLYLWFSSAFKHHSRRTYLRLHSVPDPSDYVSQLRVSVQHIHPVSPHLTQPHKKVIDGLSTATHVILRHDTVRKPFQPPYDGPYQVLKHTDNHFTLH